jgi:hypothetical protein
VPWVTAESRCQRFAVRWDEPSGALLSTVIIGRGGGQCRGGLGDRPMPAGRRGRRPPARSRASLSAAASTHPIVAGGGVCRPMHRWRRTPMTARTAFEARAPRSANSSTLFAPEATTQGHPSRIGVSEYYRPCRERESGPGSI